MSTTFGFGAGLDTRDALAEEIAALEKRLQKLGFDGDCAYERAISQLYQSLVEDRKNRLAALRAAGL